MQAQMPQTWYTDAGMDTDRDAEADMCMDVDMDAEADMCMNGDIDAEADMVYGADMDAETDMCMDGENRLSQVLLCSIHVCHGVYTHVYTGTRAHTHTN